MRRLGAAVIGVGMRGRQHAWVYSTLPEVELVAVHSRTEARARRVAEEFGAKRYYTDFHKLVRDPEVDIVSIATPDHLHKEPALSAAEAGKHMIVEKPLATSVEDAREIIKAAEKHNVMLMPFFHSRWYLHYYSVKECVERGDIGKPIYYYWRGNDVISFPSEMLSWAEKTTLAHILMVHGFDLARWFFKSEPTRVYAVAREGVLKQMGINTFDLMQATIEFSGGEIGNFEASWILPKSLSKLGAPESELIGTNGIIYVDMYHTGVELYTADKHVHVGGLLGVPSLYGEPFGAVREAIKHFVKVVSEGGKLMVEPRDGLIATITACAVTKSALERREVKVDVD